jgi:site-specific recombinase XerD
MWREHGLVFTTTLGDELGAANVRRSFRRICAAAGIGENWSPRELRHTFVSIMSASGMPIERIADLVGHTGGPRVTEQIYRQQLKPVLTEGAEIMERRRWGGCERSCADGHRRPPTARNSTVGGLPE